LGMVTDATWGDIDADGDDDLLVCGDWMAIKFVENDNGVLSLAALQGISNVHGFWNAIALVDIDRNGQLDIVAGNLGLNNILQADSSSSIQLYLGDFNENGSSDPLIFYKYFDRYIPLGSKDKLVSQLPGLKKKFSEYNEFAKVENIEGLIPDGREKLIEEKSVNELRSMLFLQGKTGFKELALPNLIQQSKVQDITYDETTGQLYFVFNGYESVASLGSSNGHSGIRLGSYDASSKKFKQLDILDLPPGLNTRQIIQADNDGWYVICNNDHQYFLVKP